MTFKKPEIISKGSNDALRDRPHARLPEFLGIFYALDELRKIKKYRLIYLIGTVGIIGTTISAIIFIVMFYIVYYLPNLKL